MFAPRQLNKPHSGRRPTVARLGAPAILALCLVATLLSGAAAGADTSLRVLADPPSVPADGASSSMIVVQVSDATGAPARDGTEVIFSTTLGSITYSAETRDGLARALLTSSTQVGIAIVSVIAGDARSELEVEFITAGGEARSAATVASLQGEEVFYSQAAGVATARGEGVFKYGSTTVRAAALQFRVSARVLAAQANVEISNGHKTIQADALIYNLRQGGGTLLKYEGEEALLFDFQSPSLGLIPKEAGSIEELRPVCEDSGNTHIVARRLQVLPNGKAVFDDASILVEGVELFSFPHYVVEQGYGERDFIERTLCLTPGVGLTADFPFHYIARPGRIGSVRLMHNLGAQSSIAGNWGLKLEEQYYRGEKAQGSFMVDNLIDESPSLRWEHSHAFSSTLNASSSLRYSVPGGGTPRSLEFSNNLSKALPKMSLNLALRASSFADAERYSAALSANSHSKPLGNSGLRYSTALRLGYQKGSYSYASSYVAADGSTSASPESTETFSTGVSLQLMAPTRKLDEATTINSNLTLSNTWSAGGASQALSANARLNRKLGKLGSLGLNYSLRLTSDRGIGHQGLSCNIAAGKTLQWHAQGFVSYDVEQGSLFGSGNLAYYLPFDLTDEGRPQWALRVSSVVSRWGSTRIFDTKASLARSFGRVEVSLNYSPGGSSFDSGFSTGSTGILGMHEVGYSQDLGSRFWLEISPGRF